MVLLVNFMRGIEQGPQPVLPVPHIGSNRSETVGVNVIRRASGRKQNQRLVNG
jgi:hypothetical protein